MEMLINLLFFPLLLCGGATGDEYIVPSPKPGDSTINITKILNEFFQQGYDKRVRPNYGRDPVVVDVSMFIIGISSVSEVQMFFRKQICVRGPDAEFTLTDNYQLNIKSPY
ncbi:gamma-aminobutyric acid receptor subunit gamma-3-like, partial [Limulus polyphemus]|uniref:Gamma-aminobutyric acid receptor subunit gamma-3-like n=1 Tax=Limulus polyphemus TaxID=6850 RepID=A0ABM1T351_LIMPO